jgi:hypothetical protein
LLTLLIPFAATCTNGVLIPSGITHNTGILSDVCRQAAQGKAVTSSVRLVWALQKESQKAWVEETLAESRAQAIKANLPLAFDLYITRSASPNTSGASTPTAEYDEKKSTLGGETVDLAGGKAQRFGGRPDIATEVARVVSDSPGRTLIVGASLPFPFSSLSSRLNSTDGHFASNSLRSFGARGRGQACYRSLPFFRRRDGDCFVRVLRGEGAV